MKRIHLYLFGVVAAITASCGSSAHFMKDDVYSTRTPMVPIGTDLRDETDYAVYAYKRDRIEEKVEYSADQQRWNNFRNSTVRLNNRWNYNLGVGAFMSPTWYVMNHYQYGGLGYYNPANCMFFGYANYAYYGFSTAYPGPYYGNYYGYGGYTNMYYPNNYYFWNKHNQYSPQAGINTQSSGQVHRGLSSTGTVNYGNTPRMIRTTTTAVNPGTAVRSSASGSVNSGISGNRTSAVRSNTAIRVNTTTNTSISNNGNRSASPDRSSGTVNSSRPTLNPGRNTNTNTSTPNRGTVAPRSTSPSNGGSRPSGGSSPAGGSRGTGRR